LRGSNSNDARKRAGTFAAGRPSTGELFPHPVKRFTAAAFGTAVIAIGILGSSVALRSAPGASAMAADVAEGPAAALAFARSFRGEAFKPNDRICYPDATGIPFADCEHIIPMEHNLWTPRQLCADFQRRMAALPVAERKKGIIVLLKTERCAPKAFRGCSVTTAALEKRATPLAGDFLIYGVLLKPRDRDTPPGSLKIETGLDAWKNDAAGEYQFKQGPGATLAFLDPADGTCIGRTDAMTLALDEKDFVRAAGETPKLHAKLQEILAALLRPSRNSVDAER
jgi:hypothetical protein